MSDRNWISREEIAQIYDERARQAALWGGPMGNTDEAHRLWRTAADIRATDKLENVLGNRT